jgi:hypothetical protein
MKMPDALRSVGLDEIRLANEYGTLVNNRETAKNPKQKLEILKEYGKLLGAYPKDTQASGQDPVEIVIDVPRPSRDATASGSDTSPFDLDRSDL